MQRISTTNLRNNLRRVLASLEKKRIVLVTKKGKNIGALLSIGFYNRVMNTASREMQRKEEAERMKNGENKENQK